jgi:hypothetical protein
MQKMPAPLRFISPMECLEVDRIPEGELWKCGEIFDRRTLDEVLFHHTDHKHRPDIQYSGSKKLP